VPTVASGARSHDLSSAFIRASPFVRPEILMGKSSKIVVFCDVTSCSPIGKYGPRAVTLCSSRETQRF
jgi:hypothetical protein